jgi:uncharacterized protein
MTLDTPLPRPPIGWPFLPVPDEHGEIAYPASLADSVRQQLQVLISTRPGEQLMRPAYGAGLTDFLGEPDNIATRKRIYDRIQESISRWEPRINMDRLDVSSLQNKPGWLRIELSYSLRRTGQSESFGVNLELS